MVYYCLNHIRYIIPLKNWMKSGRRRTKHIFRSMLRHTASRYPCRIHLHRDIIPEVRMSPTISSSLSSSSQPLTNKVHILILYCTYYVSLVLHLWNMHVFFPKQIALDNHQWQSTQQRCPKMPRKAGTLRHTLLQQEADGGERSAVGLQGVVVEPTGVA